MTLQVDAAHLLAGIEAAEVRTDPFPHLVVSPALPDATVTALLDTVPPEHVLRGDKRPGSNRRFSFPAHEALSHEQVGPIWRALVEACTSQEFFGRLMTVFAPWLRRTYPDLEARVGPIERLRAGMRFRDDFDAADVLLDALISINTPVTGRASAVRRAHVDSPHKLFAGLLYLRGPADDSRGGDLELFRFRGGTRVFRDAEVTEQDVEAVATVPYARNTLVIYPNSLHALHGVTVRQPTPHTRLFLNLVGELREPLFDLAAHQKPDLVRAVVPAWARRAVRTMLGHA
jgi:hypothetical protein